MADSFDSIAFAEQIGQELVAAFQLAGFATTHGLIGSAREVPVKDKLAQILPRGIGVGSGCVIDSFGSTSRQMDIVLYEQDICPVYAVNQDPASTYYPCEGVMAVGKSRAQSLRVSWRTSSGKSRVSRAYADSRACRLVAGRLG